MTKEEKLARKQQRKAEKVGLGKLLLWNSSSCSVASPHEQQPVLPSRHGGTD